MKILNRFLSIIFSVGFIPVLPVFIFLIFYQTSGKENILRYHLNIAEISARMAEENLAQLSLRISNYERLSGEKICSYISDKNPDISFLAVLHGKEKICAAGAGAFVKLFSNSDLPAYMKEVLPAGKKEPIIGNFRIIGDTPSADIIYPLPNGLVLYVVVDLKEIFSSVYLQKIGKTGSVYFASQSGRIFSFSGFAPSLNFSSLSEKFTKNSGFFKGLSDNERNYVGAFARVGDLNLYALTLQPENEAFRETNLASSSLLFMMLLLLTVFYFVALTAAGNISMPINRLISAAERISKNDFSRQVKPDPRIKEINTLISAFNSMMRSLHRYQELQVEKVFREKEKMDLLAALISDGIILADFTGEPVYWNPAAQEILKKSGKTPQKAVCDLVKLAAYNKGKHFSLPWEKDSFYSVSVKVSPSKLDSPLIFMVIRDVSAEVKIRSVREDFFRAVAHDIRAPLLNMQGYVKLFSLNLGDKEKTAEYIKGMEEESERIFKLVESVLEMSRLESGAFKLNISSFSVLSFLKKTAERFSPVLADKNLKLNIICPKDFNLKADENLLSRALDNMLSNACKFSFDNGVIELTAKTQEGFNIISVKDYGPGISKDKMEKIFEKFTGYDPKGFGLGLSIAKAAAQAHGGSVGAFSDGKSGSEFYIKLKAL
ncbi:MAG: HAMP domain-containing protein [Elusimicrobia bacterium]|nr:HAMP domain-containing protein [Elusimicrobiota bacterium]